MAGSVGPTGEMLAPLGSLSEDEATEIFVEQIEGLRNGGVDVVWIETMSALEEARAAARAAIAVGAPYTATASFDTAGRTMMGLAPAVFARAFEDLTPPPLAVGANCGVGAADLVVSVLAMTEADPDAIVIAKANAGLPQWRDGHLHYSGSPELMQRYIALAIDAGARIVGGCCGNTPAQSRRCGARSTDTSAGHGPISPRSRRRSANSSPRPRPRAPAAVAAAGGRVNSGRSRFTAPEGSSAYAGLWPAA